MTGKRTMDAATEDRGDLERAVELICRGAIMAAQLEADRDLELTEVRSRYEPQIEQCQAGVRDALAVAAAWAAEHEEAFGTGREIECAHGTVRLRRGNPALKPAPKVTWEKVLERLQRLRRFYGGYIRTREEVDREAILRDRATLDLTKLLLREVQEERLHVVPARDAACERSVKMKRRTVRKAGGGR